MHTRSASNPTGSLDAGTLERRLRIFVRTAIALIVLTFTFLSDERYGREYHQSPSGWNAIFEGRVDAPAQYRIGVWFLANFLSRLSHIPTRHTMSLLDGFFLAIGLSTVFYLLARTRTYLNMSQAARVTTSLAALCLFLYPVPWLFFYHRGETIANFACLIVAALLVSGKTRLSPLVAAVCLLLVSAYLATIRADSGFALNLGILAVAVMPAGRLLPLGRALQAAIGLVGCVTVVGVEFCIRHFLFPNAPYPDSPFQLINNITAINPMFCVVVALAPWFVTLWLARRHWSRMEAWECALVIASAIEFAIFFIVAMANEVRVFLPHFLALVPVAAVLLAGELLNLEERSSQKESVR